MSNNIDELSNVPDLAESLTQQQQQSDQVAKEQVDLSNGPTDQFKLAENAPLHYRKICMLVCPECNYVEFPGCGEHQTLVGFPFGPLGEFACRGCLTARRANRYSSNLHVAATHLSGPWARACRKCTKKRATPMGLLFPTTMNLSILMTKYTQQQDKTELLPLEITYCPKCRVVILHKDIVPLSHQTVHALANCTGSWTTVKGNLSLEETEYCNSNWINTPYYRALLQELLISEPQSKGSNSSTGQSTVHVGVRCNQCCTTMSRSGSVGPIVGLRYECTVCQNVNFCATCEQTIANQSCLIYRNNPYGQEQRHLPTHHPLVKHVKPIQSDFLSSSVCNSLADAGFELDLFTTSQAVEPFVCALCLSVARDSKLIECGHVFCESCLRKVCNQSYECPLDRLPISESCFDQVNLAEQEVRSIIQEQTVNCLHASSNQCPWTGRLGDLQQHMDQECKWIMCDFAKYGCTVRRLRTDCTGCTNTSQLDNEHERQHNHMLQDRVSQLTEQHKKMQETFSDALKLAHHPSISASTYEFRFTSVESIISDLDESLKREIVLRTNEVKTQVDALQDQYDQQLEQDQQRILELEKSQQRIKQIIIYGFSIVAGILTTALLFPVRKQK